MAAKSVDNSRPCELEVSQSGSPSDRNAAPALPMLRQGIEQLSSRIRLLIEDMLARWQALDERIAAFDAEFSAEAKQNETMRRLTSIPGIGALNATALVAAVGDAQTFATTGGEPRLLGQTRAANTCCGHQVRPASKAF
jgi:transposase